MKRSHLIIAALAVITAIVMSFASCGAGAGTETGSAPDASSAVPAGPSGQADVLTAVLEGLMANPSYIEFKSFYPDAEFSETLEGDSLVIKIEGVDAVNGAEGTDGEYVYTLDGDYITYTSAEQDYTGPSFFMYISDAVAEYLGMAPELMSGYIQAVSLRDLENDYFITDTDDATGETTYKLFVGGAYDLSLIDDICIDETALEFTTPLGEDSTSGAVNQGRVIARYDGSASDVRIAVGEYGENTDLTYKSVMNVVAALQPAGYEAFAAEYMELAEVQGDGYSVTFGLDDEMKASGNFDGLDAYSFVVITFAA